VPGSFFGNIGLGGRGGGVIGKPGNISLVPIENCMSSTETLFQVFNDPPGYTVAGSVASVDGCGNRVSADNMITGEPSDDLSPGKKCCRISNDWAMRYRLSYLLW